MGSDSWGQGFVIFLSTKKNDNMKLGQFISEFIEPNSIIRLLYSVPGGHVTVLDDWNCVSMEHDVLNKRGKNRHYIDNEVIGVTDIMVHGHHPEAINIVIEKLDKQPFVLTESRDELIDELREIDVKIRGFIEKNSVPMTEEEISSQPMREFSSHGFVLHPGVKFALTKENAEEYKNLTIMKAAICRAISDFNVAQRCIQNTIGQDGRD